MSSRFSRRLSVVAVSASLAGIALAPHANATVWGVPGSPLTVDEANGNVEVVGGPAVHLPSGARNVAWSQDGTKAAYSYGGNLFVANADGSDAKMVAINGNYPVFADDGEYVIYSANDASGIHLKVAAANGDGVDPNSPYTPYNWDLPSVPQVSGFSDIKADYGGGGGVLAFERASVGADSGGIWVRGPQTSYAPKQVVAGNADAPTVSPDGLTVAYVAPDTQGISQVWTVPTAVPAGGVMPTPVQQTFDETARAYNPAFSPDGGSIAFVAEDVQSGSAVVKTVALNADPAATSNPATTVPTKGTVTWDSTLAYRTEIAKRVVRLAGVDRLATSVTVSQSMWRANGDAADLSRIQAKSAVLSRSDNFADALGGAALAAHKVGPLLLTDPKALDGSVRGELKRILAPGSTVYILGGTSAVSPAVEAAVTAAGFHVQRIAGNDRYETSVAIANVAAPNPTDVLVATGDGFADALSAGAAAGSDANAVVVLTDDTRMPASTGAYLRHFNTDFNIRGGAKVALWAVGNQALTAIDNYGNDQWWRYPEAGKDRYQTSYMLAHSYFGTMYSVGFATGLNWPDSLAGGALMGVGYGPLLLVDPAVGIVGQDAQLLNDNKGELYYGYVFGGPGALGSFVDRQLAAGIAGPLGVTDASGNPVPTSVKPLTAGPQASVAGGHDVASGSGGAAAGGAGAGGTRAAGGAGSTTVSPSLP